MKEEEKIACVASSSGTHRICLLPKNPPTGLDLSWEIGALQAL